MRVQRPVFTDFALQAELFTVGGSSSSIAAVLKPIPWFRDCTVFSVDAFDGHHRHQDMFLFDQARVAGKQRFDKEWLVGHHHVVNPEPGYQRAAGRIRRPPAR